jgi:hypothetical protein
MQEGFSKKVAEAAAARNSPAWPVYRFARAPNTKREDMEINVSEAKEEASYGEMKGLVMRMLEEFKPNVGGPSEEREGKARGTRGERKDQKAIHPGLKLTKAPEIVQMEEARKRKREEDERRAQQEGKEVKKRKSRAQVRKDKKKTEALRQISFRLHLTPQLKEIFRHWFDLYDDIYNHVVEICDNYLKGGYDMPPLQYTRDKLVVLSRLGLRRAKREGRELADLERRLKYMELPAQVQQEAVAEFYSNRQSAQTNMERKHNKGYEMQARDPDRRWRWLRFSKQSLSVDEEGRVILCQQHIPATYPDMYPNSETLPWRPLC